MSIAHYEDNRASYRRDLHCPTGWRIAANARSIAQVDDDKAVVKYTAAVAVISWVECV
jgi:hypothetical protein